MKKIVFIIIVASLASCKKKHTTAPDVAITSNVIITIAGNGKAGYNGDNQSATAAELYQPSGIAVDNSNNIYIADKANNRIRKINTSGVITTVAGNGTQGYMGDGGAADAAELSNPSGVAVDNSGNVYIADNGNNVIRKVNTSGVINTIAGTNTITGYSGDGGPATNAKLNIPASVTADNSGNIFIADEDNNVIRKVNSSGIIMTVAGNGTYGYNGDNGPATAAELNQPKGVAIDNSGNIYIADYNNNRIRKVNTSGIITTIAGNGYGAPLSGGYSGDGGAATAGELYFPTGVAIDNSGNIYIADYYNNLIREVNASGIISTFAGTGFGAGTATGGYSGDGGAATAAELSSPVGVAVDASGNVYIADMNNERARSVSK